MMHVVSGTGKFIHDVQWEWQNQLNLTSADLWKRLWNIMQNWLGGGGGKNTLDVIDKRSQQDWCDINIWELWALIQLSPKPKVCLFSYLHISTAFVKSNKAKTAQMEHFQPIGIWPILIKDLT